VQAVILAGGMGTRMQSLLGDGVKPMLPLAGRPFLEYVVLRLKAAGLVNIIMCIGHRGEQIRQYFRDGSTFGISIQYSQEAELRGTGGALKLAEPFLSGPCLVLNGDSFFGVDVPTLIRAHQNWRAGATLALAHVEGTCRYGSVELDEASRICRFAEKHVADGSGLINAGIYVFEPQVITSIRSDRAVSLERDVFPNLIGRQFFGMASRAYFVDIGIPEDYLALQTRPEAFLAAVA
jgi:NDP-sugar pyrophosphorylase family protein